MTTSSLLAIFLATVAQFAVGAIWYMPLFGKIWGEIHCFDQLDKKTQKAMQAQMGPYYGAQLLVTLVTTIVLSRLISAVSGYSAYMLAIMLWGGFVVPTQVGAVIFGGTEPRWIAKKIVIMAGGSLACLLVAAAVLSYLG
jgi:hypothetical protein